MRKTMNDLYPMNLQFFAEEGEGEGVNEVEAADPQEAETTEAAEGTEGVDSGETAEPQVQSDEANRAFASMRRAKEAAEKQLADINRMYATQFGNFKNPETGQPIRGVEDYLEALNAQKRMEAREQLRQNNMDPNLIDQMIANSPAVRRAEEATAELNNIRAQQMMEADFAEVMKLDPSMTSRDDILNDPSYGVAVDYIVNHPGIRFSDAYKIVNFDRLSSSKTAAARQAVVNQVKGQAHLSNAPGLTTNDALEDIPAAMIENFRERFPEKTDKELKALYNKVLKTQKG